jgi:drug/metabolite transporter (DMT)-like permease
MKNQLLPKLSSLVIDTKMRSINSAAASFGLVSESDTETGEIFSISNVRFSRLALVLCAALYASDFICTKRLQRHISSSAVTCARFLVAALSGLINLLLFHRSTSGFLGGIEIGFYNSVGFALTAISLETVSAQKVAFCTGLAMVFCPLFDIIAGYTVTFNSAILSPALAILAIALMNSGSEAVAFQTRDILLLLNPMAFGLGIWRSEKLVKNNPEGSSCLASVNLCTIACVMSCWAIYSEGSLFELISSFQSLDRGSVYLIMYMGVIATACVVMLEQRALRFISASEASIIYSLEPIFGAIFASIFLKEPIGPATFVAAILVLLANRVGTSN